MSKLILSASLLLILEISIAQTANDKSKLIIAPYSICLQGTKCKDTTLVVTCTLKQIVDAGGFECSFPGFEITYFRLHRNGIEGIDSFWFEEVGCNGNLYSEAAIKLINRLTPGQLLFVDAVTIRNPTGKVFGLPPRIFKVIGK